MARFGTGCILVYSITLLLIISYAPSYGLRSPLAALVPDKVHGLIDAPAAGVKKAVEVLEEVVPESVPESLIVGEEENSTETCFERLGCFPLGKPWTSLLRPVPAPINPFEILASVTLYTRAKPEGYHQSFNTTYNIEASDFNIRRNRTAIITHGFASNGDSSWLHEMKDGYLSREDANVFILDWGKGASYVNYLQVASNTRVVGAQLAKFVRYLIEKGQKTEKIHLIGHSLGSHIMSYCAKNISEISKINRITALDPAQPAFEAQPKKVRLDVNDAVNIDVYHTDAKPFIPFLGFGMLAPVGTVDFYFNGGSMQPGCLEVKKPNITSISDLLLYPVEVVAEWVSCSHGRSYEYFTAALKLRNCSIWGRKMTMTENFAKITTLGRLTLADRLVDSLSQCTKETCSVAGLDTFNLPARGSFAVTTNSDPPYCETTEDEMRHLKNQVTLGFYDYVPGLGKKLVDKLSFF